MIIRTSTVHQGDGVVIQNPTLMAVVATADHPVAKLLLDGFEGDPISQLSAAATEDAPDFAAIVFGQGDGRLFVRGNAVVQVDDETFRHDDALEFFDRRVAVGPKAVLAVRLATSADPLPWSTLTHGAVAGGGLTRHADFAEAAMLASGGHPIAHPSTPPPSPPPLPGNNVPATPDRLVSFIAPPATPPQAGVPPAEPPPRQPPADLTPPPAPEPASAPRDASPDRVMVHGIRCQREHLVHPDARICPLCGDNMQNRSIVVGADGSVGELGPRPPLGILILPDGRSYQLNRTTILGRQPSQEASVRTGEVDGLVVDGTNISRVHARVVLDEWTVSFEDLGSANGCAIGSAGGAPIRLQDNEARLLNGAADLYLGSTRLVFQPTSAAPVY